MKIRILVLYIGSLSGFYGWVRIQILCMGPCLDFYLWVWVRILYTINLVVFRIL
jgi:hypothetical protein